MTPNRPTDRILLAAVLLTWTANAMAAENRSHPPEISGIYPQLAYFNDGGECGTGAVVPWADRLWLVTYSPHSPGGSSDKLYQVTPELELIPFEGSVGGTPANRMIHRESNQLLIGPYLIDAKRNIRVIPPSKMFGRLTGNARHLTDPAAKVYYATMEEGFYEVDVRSLAVKELFPDGNRRNRPADAGPAPPAADLPGYHGKGLYSGQGWLIYANNGEASGEARRRPDIPSGCLGEWDGKSPNWTVVRRNQFTDVTGPGGIHGNDHPATDPIWSIGWDYRSLILMLLDEGQWHSYRLPKAVHTYDGAHGWNTEWPRIRDIGEDDLLMTMHGMFWHFPKTFTADNSAGIAPRSTYLKVIGDFCRWGDRLVFGCDDTAKSEFLNTRRAKGKIEGPGQSHSNLWFAAPAILDQLGAPIGRGAVWLRDDVEADTPSDPFLFDGFARRSVHVGHGGSEPVTFTFEVDRQGNGQWSVLRRVTVSSGACRWESFDPDESGVWLRVRTDRPCENVTVQFHYANPDTRSTTPDRIFAGLARPESRSLSAGLVRVRGERLQTLAFAATRVVDGKADATGFYELGGDLQLKHVDDQAAYDWLVDAVPVPTGVLETDAASVVYVDDSGRRWRLPKGDPAMDQPGLLGPERVDREVVTERDLFNCHGTFYELPARNAGGFAKIRPIATHNMRIKDYCSYRGMLVLSGVDADAPADNPHIIRSDDGKVALWVGVVDDLWRLGKPVGQGGPWNETAVKARQPSDPYLMTGYDRKTLRLGHDSDAPVKFTIEVDITGDGMWVPYQDFAVPVGKTVTHEFPEAFNAYWLRAKVDSDCRATAMLTYE